MANGACTYLGNDAAIRGGEVQTRTNAVFNPDGFQLVDIAADRSAVLMGESQQRGIIKKARRCPGHVSYHCSRGKEPARPITSGPVIGVLRARQARHKTGRGRGVAGKSPVAVWTRMVLDQHVVALVSWLSVGMVNNGWYAKRLSGYSVF